MSVLFILFCYVLFPSLSRFLFLFFRLQLNIAVWVVCARYCGCYYIDGVVR